MFVSSPSLLLMGDVPTMFSSALTATVGVVCLAGGLHAYFFFGPARWWDRILLVVAALVLIKPGWQTDLIGVALIAAVIGSQLLVRGGSAKPLRQNS